MDTKQSKKSESSKRSRKLQALIDEVTDLNSSYDPRAEAKAQHEELVKMTRYDTNDYGDDAFILTPRTADRFVRTTIEWSQQSPKAAAVPPTPTRKRTLKRLGGLPTMSFMMNGWSTWSTSTSPTSSTTCIPTGNSSLPPPKVPRTVKKNNLDLPLRTKPRKAVETGGVKH